MVAQRGGLYLKVPQRKIATKPLKLLLFTGIRNAELVHLRLTAVDLQACQLRITQGKGAQDRYVLFPTHFRGELAQYIERQRARGATYLFESNRCQPYSTRRIRQLVKQYAHAAGIAKRVYPHLFRHQLLTRLGGLLPTKERKEREE